jgi:hypothetical protein
MLTYAYGSESYLLAGDTLYWLDTSPLLSSLPATPPALLAADMLYLLLTCFTCC